jgi:hypothetical protein
MNKPPRNERRCDCGRLRSEAEVNVLRLRSSRHTYHVCACGAEWTDNADAVNLLDPISSEEVLSVHERLDGFEGTFGELLGARW